MYDARSQAKTVRGTYELTLTAPLDGDYYISVYGQATAGPIGSYLILAKEKTRYLSDLVPRAYGNVGYADLRVSGTGFVDNLQASLRHDDAILSATSVEPTSSTVLRLRFNAADAPIGVYDLQVTWPDWATEQLLDAFEVAPVTSPHVRASLSLPSTHRPGRTSYGRLEFDNAGNVAMPAPLVILSTTAAVPLKTACESTWITGTLQFLASGEEGPAGILGPGAKGELPFYFQGLGPHVVVKFQATAKEASDEPVDWNAYKAGMRPAGISPEEWDLLWPKLVARLGNTWTDYLGVLGRDAERLRRRGQPCECVRQLLALEIKQARGLPTAAIAGKLISTDNSLPLTGVRVVAYRDDGQLVRTQDTLAPNGVFSLDDLPTGHYDILVEGSYLDPPVQVEIAGDQDVTGLVLLAHPVPESEFTPPEAATVPDHRPALAADSSGAVHLVWQRGEQLWHGLYDSGTWTNTIPISGAIGTDPAIVFGPQGLTAAWQNLAGNNARIRLAQATKGQDGRFTWHEPITLTLDAYGDTMPDLTTDLGGGRASGPVAATRLEH